MNFPVDLASKWQNEYKKSFARINELITDLSWCETQEEKERYTSFIDLVFHKIAYDAFPDFWCPPVYQNYQNNITIAEELLCDWRDTFLNAGCFKFYVPTEDVIVSQPPFFLDFPRDNLWDKENFKKYMEKYFPYITDTSEFYKNRVARQERMLKVATERQDEALKEKFQKLLDASKKPKYKEVPYKEWLDFWPVYAESYKKYEESVKVKYARLY